MPRHQDPSRWAAAALIAVSAMVVVLVTVRGGASTPNGARPSVTAAPLLLDHLAAPLPPPRGDAAMAFDSRRNEVVLFGGYAVDNPSGPPLTDTWVLQGRRWLQRHPTVQPAPMLDQLMVFDAGMQTCVLVGLPSSGFVRGSAVVKQSAETWSWDGTNWTRFSDVRFSSVEDLQGIAFDPTTGRTLLVTAPNAGPPVLHTWTWDRKTWTLQQRADPFHERVTRPSLATISRSTPAGQGPGVLMVFGTALGTETWFWGGASWSTAAENRTPPYDPLTASMAGDPTTGTVVLIGVPGGSGSDSTWVWDGEVWNEPAGGPNVDSHRGATVALSDTSTGHPIVIGDQPNQLDVIWTWDGQRWVTDAGV